MSLDAERWRRVRRLFEEIVELPSAERAERLAATPDQAIRQEVGELLDAHGSDFDLLDTPVEQIAAPLMEEAKPAPAPDAAEVPELLGPYRVLGPLGSGGMGEVYLAERADGLFEQRVAIKLLKTDSTSDDILRRFARERQILARLQHPGIARLLDAGQTPQGRPYFVLELVEGQAINLYCEGRRSPIAERVRLIAECCEAVAFAHRNLVIHRDIKPSNILVTAAGEVKLLDFGIAKVLVRDDVTDPALTRLEERILTPRYAAPEQILGEPITTGTDVYALGLLLYELLVGAPPQRRDTRSTIELVSAIAEEPIERPSEALDRGSDPMRSPWHGTRARRRWRSELRGDLDNIVLMALRHEPERRYRSASELGEDLTRYLEGQPVRARADTLGYRAAKFLRRHRWAASGAAAAGLSLAIGVGAALWQGQRAAQQASRAERVKEFLLQVFAVANPDSAGGESITARRLLADGAARIESDLANEPAVQAELFDVVANIQLSLGLFEEARTSAERALARRRELFGPHDLATAESLATLGSIEAHLRAPEAGEGRLREALEITVRVAGPTSLPAARQRVRLGEALARSGRHEEAIALLEQALAVLEAQLGLSHQQTWAARAALAGQLDATGRPDEALDIYRRALEQLERAQPRQPLALANLRRDYAAALTSAGHSERAEAEARRALEEVRQLRGQRHFDTAAALETLAVAVESRGDMRQSIELLEQAAGIFREARHPRYWETQVNLATAEFHHGEKTVAVVRMREALEYAERNFGPLDVGTLSGMLTLLGMLPAAGLDAEAETLSAALLERLRASPAQANLSLFVSAHWLTATLDRRAGRIDRAETTLRGSLAWLVENAPPGAPEISVAELQLASLLLESERTLARAEARRLLARLAGTPALPLTAAQRQDVEAAIARLDSFEGHCDRAVPALEKLLREPAAMGPAPVRQATLQLSLGLCYRQLRRESEARSLLESAHTTLLERRGELDPSTERARRALGRPAIGSGSG